MSARRKISVRKIAQTVMTILLFGCCIFATLSTARIQAGKKIKGIAIRIKNGAQCQFINEESIKETLLQQKHITLAATKLDHIDTRRMEKILCANPWIENADVYVDNNQVLSVSVTQRIPEFRVFEPNGDSYYLDSTLAALPLSSTYTHYCMVFVCVPELGSDSLTQSMKGQMMHIARQLKKDEFWNVQIEHVVLNEHYQFELIPILGKHKILIGDTTRLQEKLADVFVFYKKILNEIGWDRYELLDVRYKNQVVASPSLPWKPPVDNALSNMNWVKTIVGDDKDKQEETGDFPLTASVTANQAIQAKANAEKKTQPTNLKHN